MFDSKQQTKFQFDVPLAKFTSWRIGGSARKYLKPNNTSELQAALLELPAKEPVLWLGLGSNLLIRDAGFAGTVIHMHRCNDSIEIISESDDEVLLEVGAGVTCAKIAKFATKHKLAQADFFIGIPGTMGGALAMNAGAFGGVTWPIVSSVDILMRQGELKKLSAENFEYSYRNVKPKFEGEFVYLSAVLKLSKAVKFEPEKTKELLRKRANSQPIGKLSCGSVFKNPENGHAAEYIERAKLKGVRIGGAVVSSKHANFILNEKDAKASDVEALIKHVQSTVWFKFAVMLQPEVKIVGIANE